MSEKTMDLEEFMERVQDDKELLLELLDIFVEDYKKKRALLGTAIETQDFDEVRSVAHSLKGASGNISAKDLREVMKTLEEKGVAKDLTGAGDLLAKVDEAYAALGSEIEKVKKDLAG